MDVLSLLLFVGVVLMFNLIFSLLSAHSGNVHF